MQASPRPGVSIYTSFDFNLSVDDCTISTTTKAQLDREGKKKGENTEARGKKKIRFR